jgi:hypothetical protein
MTGVGWEQWSSIFSEHKNRSRCVRRNQFPNGLISLRYGFCHCVFPMSVLITCVPQSPSQWVKTNITIDHDQNDPSWPFTGGKTGKRCNAVVWGVPTTPKSFLLEIRVSNQSDVAHKWGQRTRLHIQSYSTACYSTRIQDKTIMYRSMLDPCWGCDTFSEGIQECSTPLRSKSVGTLEKIT